MSPLATTEFDRRVAVTAAAFEVIAEFTVLDRDIGVLAFAALKRWHD